MGRDEIENPETSPGQGIGSAAIITGAGVCTRCSDDFDGSGRGAGFGKTGVPQQSSCAHAQQEQTRAGVVSSPGKANELRAIISPSRMLHTAFTVLLSF
jgi:hypothetical protein